MFGQGLYKLLELQRFECKNWKLIAFPFVDYWTNWNAKLVRFEANANVVFAFEAKPPSGAVGDWALSSEWLMIEGAIASAMEHTATILSYKAELNW